MKVMRMGATGIVESLMEQGYSIKESLEVLEEARQKINSIRKFMYEQTEGTYLKDAFQEQVGFIDMLQKSGGAINIGRIRTQDYQ